MAQNQQVGTQIYSRSPPTFAGYVVMGGTWNESDSLTTDNVQNQDEATFNTTGWDPGLDVSCSLFALSQTTFPLVLDVISEITPTTRKWLVMSVQKKYAKRKVMFDVKLQFRAAQDLTIIS